MRVGRTAVAVRGSPRVGWVWAGLKQRSLVVSCLGPASWSRMVANGRQHVHVSSVDTTGMIGMP